jgi:hypothetical protein
MKYLGFPVKTLAGTSVLISRFFEKANVHRTDLLRSYYDNLSAKQCHGKPLPCNLEDRSACVSQDLVR